MPNAAYLPPPDPDMLSEPDAIRERQIRALELQLRAHKSTVTWERLKRELNARTPEAIRFLERRKGLA